MRALLLFSRFATAVRMNVFVTFLFIFAAINAPALGIDMECIEALNATIIPCIENIVSALVVIDIARAI